MVYRRNIRSKKVRSSKKISRRVNKRKQPKTTSASTFNQQSIENIDDETKLAKRHLTKEMWQLISIAVKRMADELVAISNNQQTIRTSNQDLSVTFGDIKTDVERSVSTTTTTVQQSKIANGGAGDEVGVNEKVNSTNTSNKQCITAPLQMIQTPTNKKKKETSNNAKRQTNKSKKSKKNSNQNLRNNRK